MIRVIDPGVSSTIQDLGRPGHASIGVVESGAADLLSHRVANRMVGNADDVAIIELTYPRAEFRVESTCIVALGGLGVMLERASGRGGAVTCPAWRPIECAAGDVLRVRPAPGSRAGLRPVLAFRGGIDVPSVLGSRATHVASGLGGLEGRALRAGDVLSRDEADWSAKTATRGPFVDAATLSEIEERLSSETIRVMPGPQAELLGEPVLGAIGERTWTVSPASTRIGTVLTPSSPLGDLLLRRVPRGLRSEPMSRGVVQVLPSGEIVVLGPDRPTVGGYAVAAVVAMVDHAALAQRMPREGVRFELVTRENALGAWRDLWRTIDHAIPPQALTSSIDINCDLGEEPDALARDEEIAANVSSMNIACGGHAGDERTMRSLVRVAKKCGVAIGAHPSYPDRTNFGRAPMSMRPDDLERSVRQQIAALSAIANAEGTRVSHVKPHGALYHAAAHDAGTAEAVARAIALHEQATAVYIMAGAPTIGVFRGFGLTVVEEAFADRKYETGTRLLPREEPGAVLCDAAMATQQSREIILRHRVKTPGGWEGVSASTLCFHGDTRETLGNIRAVCLGLIDCGVRVAAPGKTQI